jgi:hypothetical protein
MQSLEMKSKKREIQKSVSREIAKILWPKLPILHPPFKIEAAFCEPPNFNLMESACSNKTNTTPDTNVFFLIMTTKGSYQSFCRRKLFDAIIKECNSNGIYPTKND